MGRKKNRKKLKGFNPEVQNNALTLALASIKLVPIDLAFELIFFDAEQLGIDYYLENEPQEVKDGYCNWCRNLSFEFQRAYVCRETRNWALKFSSGYIKRRFAFVTGIQLLYNAAFFTNCNWDELPCEVDLEKSYSKFQRGEKDEFCQVYFQNYGKYPRFFVNQFGETWIKSDYWSEDKIREEFDKILISRERD